MLQIQTQDTSLESFAPALPRRSVFQAMFRGARKRCPACGTGKLFPRYLKVADHCPACGEAMHHHRADDAPPYFTIFIAGHLIVPLLMLVETTLKPPIWLQAMVWPALATITCLALLPPVKGAVVGLQWALYMHGFEPGSADEMEHAQGKRLG